MAGYDLCCAYYSFICILWLVDFVNLLTVPFECSIFDSGNADFWRFQDPEHYGDLNQA